MESQRSQFERQHPPSTSDPAVTSCRKKKSEDISFLTDVRDHIDEFIHPSMDEHQTCFKKTIQLDVWNVKDGCREDFRN